MHAKIKENQKLSDQIIQLKKAQVEAKENLARKDLKNDSNKMISLTK